VGVDLSFSSTKSGDVWLVSKCDGKIDKIELMVFNEEIRPILKEVATRNMHRMELITRGNNHFFSIISNLVIETPFQYPVNQQPCRDRYQTISLHSVRLIYARSKTSFSNISIVGPACL
jgi:hypothetical protein